MVTPGGGWEVVPENVHVPNKVNGIKDKIVSINGKEFDLNDKANVKHELEQLLSLVNDDKSKWQWGNILISVAMMAATIFVNLTIGNSNARTLYG